MLSCHLSHIDHHATRWYCRYLIEEWDTALSRSYDVAVLQRDGYASAGSGSSYKNIIQGTVIVLHRRRSTKAQCISVNDRWRLYHLGQKKRKLTKWGGVSEKSRKRLDKRFPLSKIQHVHVNAEIEVGHIVEDLTQSSDAAVGGNVPDVGCGGTGTNGEAKIGGAKSRARRGDSKRTHTNTTKRRATQAKKKANSKRRRRSTSEAPACDPSASACGSFTHFLALRKHVEEQSQILSRMVKEVAAVRQVVEQQAKDMAHMFGGLRASMKLEIGCVRTELDKQKHLANRLLARGRTHTEVMRSIFDKLDS